MSNGNQGNEPANPPAQPPNDNWKPVTSAVFGGITLLFFMFILLLTMGGLTISESGCNIVSILFGMFGGLSFWFISGTVLVSGQVPIPKLGTSFAIKAGGGIGAVIGLYVLSHSMACGNAPKVVVGIDNVQTFPDKDGDRLAVQVAYTISNNNNSHVVSLEASWDEKFTQPTRTQLDKPEEKQATVDLRRNGHEPGSPFWLRIVVKDRDGTPVVTSAAWKESSPHKK